MIEQVLSNAAKNLLIGQIKEQILSALIKRFAFFGLPIVNPLVSMLVGQIIAIGLENTILGINLIWIDLENKRETKQYLNALNKLKSVTDNTDETFKQKALDEFKKSARDLIRLNMRRL